MKKVKCIVIIVLVILAILIPVWKANAVNYSEIQPLIKGLKDIDNRREFINKQYYELLGTRMMETYSGYGTTIEYPRAACLSHTQTSDTTGGQYRVETVIDLGYNDEDGFFAKSYYKDSSLEYSYNLGTYTDTDNNSEKKRFIEKLNYGIYNLENAIANGKTTNNGQGINSDQEAYIGYLIRQGMSNTDNGIKWIQASDAFKYQKDYRDIFEGYNNAALNTNLKEFKAVKVETFVDTKMTEEGETQYKIGPLKLDFSGKSIEKIKINGVEAELIKCEDENGNEKTPLPPNEKIYLTIKSNNRVSGENNEITFCQEAVEYYKGRILLLRSINQQQYGIFAGVPETLKAEDTIELDATKTTVLQIKKIAAHGNKEALSGVKLQIYANVEGKTNHWLKKQGEEWKYKKYRTEADVFETDESGMVKLEGLEYGTYYIYEVGAAEGYNLEDQRAFYSNHPENEEPTNDEGRKYSDIETDGQKPAYLFKVKLNEAKPKSSTTVKQYMPLTLGITKYDCNTEAEIQGVGIKVLAVIDNENKWIKQNKNNIEYIDNMEGATEFITDKEGYIEINGLLRNHFYYIYETKAAEGYNLENQRKYYPDSNDKKNIANGEGTPVFLGRLSDQATRNRETIYVDWEQYTSASLTINKVDSKDRTGNKLNGSRFAIFEKGKGWLGYDSANQKVTYGNNWSGAKQFQTGVAYCNETAKQGEFTLTGLKYGDYYVIETKTPSREYLLSDQVGYSSNSNYGFLSKDEWKMDGIESVLIGVSEKNQEYDKEYRDVYKVYLSDKEIENEPPDSENEEFKKVGREYRFVRARAYYLTEDDVMRGEDYSVSYVHLDFYSKRYIEEDPNIFKNEGKFEEKGGANNYEYVTYFGSIHPTYFVGNKKSNGSLRIEKVDEDKREIQLTGAKYKIYGICESDLKGWITGNADETKTFSSSSNAATEYESYTDIKNLKKGTYYIFETKAPEGYDLTKQEEPTGKPIDLQGAKYRGSVEVGSGSAETMKTTYQDTNKKIISLEGMVWIDTPHGKNNQDNYIYDQGEDLVSGIPVTLRKRAGTQIAETSTDSNGRYKFENLNYWDVEDNAYVEFGYDNENYICIPTFQGDNKNIASWAKEETMDKEELDDNNLTGIVGVHPGKAITDKSSKLTNDYNKSDYTIRSVNLGLLKKLKPEFSITEDIAYMKVQFGGDIYRYKYMEDDEQLKRTTAPTVNEQVSKRTFTGKIYPSDVAYNMATDTETLKVYVVYRINVFNNTSYNIENNYIEEKMYVESLTNTYDSSKYKLSTDSNDKVDSEDAKKDFDLWTVSGDTASYNCNNTWRDKYKNGVKTEFDGNGNIIEGREGYVTTYIQFQLTEDFVEKILKKHLTEGDLEEAPSTATAVTFHEYLRSDNVWKSGNEKYYEGHKQQSYNVGTTRYLHKSLNQTATTSELGMKFGLPENERTISGVVFEDTITDENKAAEKALGNGLKETNENTVSNVRVELLNSKNSDEPVTLYQNSTSSNANYQTQLAIEDVEEGGKFEFKGVIPGTYYIRFTYGDGTQRLYDTSGNIVKEKVKAEDGNEINKEVEVKLSDYKSTIIDASTSVGQTIKAAMEAADNDNSHIQWYKDINGKNYSTAVDDLTERSETDGSVYYKDRKAYDNSGNEKSTRTSVDAYTPKFLVTLENDKDEDRTSSGAENYNDNGLDSKRNINYYDFTGFNFGIIKAPDIKITPMKTIKNITITNQVGTTLISADPRDKKASYISSLQEIDSGSTEARLEIEQNLVYGAGLTATYDLTLKNESPYTDWIEKNEEGSDYGYYYKYGIISENTREKEVDVQELQDTLDTEYKSLLGDGAEVKLTETKYDKQQNKQEINTEQILVKSGEKTKVNKEGYVVEEPDGLIETKEIESVVFTGWSGIKKGETVSITYDAKALLSSDEDNQYINNAQITKIKLDKLTTLTSESDWHKLVNTRLTITPPTGQDRRYTIYIITSTLLLCLGVGIVLIKKYVL